jgi:hypothetical protein
MRSSCHVAVTVSSTKRHMSRGNSHIINVKDVCQNCGLSLGSSRKSAVASTKSLINNYLNDF